MIEEKILAADLIKSLRERPKEWRWDDDLYFQIRHQSGITIWISSGLFEIHPYRFSWGLIDWWKLRRAFRSWSRGHGEELRQAEKKAGLSDAISRLKTSSNVITRRRWG